MLFRQLFDQDTWTYTYLIADSDTKEAVLVDPVIEQVERDLKLVRELGLTLKYCMETHVHADHITGTGKIRELTGCKGLVPEKAKVNCADRHLVDNEVVMVGNVEIRAIASPGHTDCHFAYLVNNSHLLTGDALFIRGCGRTDFQSGDARMLYDTITKRFFTLADDVLVYPGHDYRGHTVSTIAEEKAHNPRISGKKRDEFIELMDNLDLPDPKKIMEAVPANQMCGKV
ncbi:MBL fold metallo-hydrolase [Cyanobacterium stanieri LEGE 03274]|uniref:MBL fold metallo-hydrolase n=1 Tax=Cyanobacterium stanieri LEGE 03274 TaxID=1828756 RepID=A0ABR9V619_9CHRO|nr:MBL fold metallo-hydrolase [Cyanobacterium stanieri]MBE9223346.1 MBL fold metallo-hydrolase [Cyanobacterium stanieri LEGE 03274]